MYLETFSDDLKFYIRQTALSVESHTQYSHCADSSYLYFVL